MIAGIADAVGYITMGGVFAANMTGNTVLAGIAAAEGRYPRRRAASRAAARLLPWRHAGAPAAASVAPADGPVLLVEAALSPSSASCPSAPNPPCWSLALAMGLQASAITHFAGTRSAPSS